LYEGELRLMKQNQHTPTTQRLAIAAFLLAGSLLLAACGGATQGSAATAAAAVAATTETATDTAAQATTAADTDSAATTTSETTTAAVQKLNLNTVTGDQLLATIPNFGSRMVREFGEYRPYVSIQQFRKEIGKYVDEAQVAEYEKYVYVPVNVNEADEATLQQIPGVDAAAAAALVAARPYADNQAFLAKLAEVAPQSDAATAAAYVEAQ
jgi:DNA uptake protein ComE-like DNA-binding protein